MEYRASWKTLGFVKGHDELVCRESCLTGMRESYAGLRPASLQPLSGYTSFWRPLCGQSWVFFCLCGVPVT